MQLESFFFFFEKIFPANILVVSNLLLEVPKLKENVLIYIITVKKACDLLLTFTQTFPSNNNTCGITSKMNEHRLLILINTSYLINY